MAGERGALASKVDHSINKSYLNLETVLEIFLQWNLGYSVRYISEKFLLSEEYIRQILNSFNQNNEAF